MKRQTAARMLAIIVAVSVVLACGPSAFIQQQEGGEGGDATETATPVAQEPTLTATVPPTETPTPPPSETPTASVTPGPNFGAASVYAVSHLEGSRLLVTIQVPGGGFTTSYVGRVASSDMPCEVLAQYPDRLYCSGPEPYTNYTIQPATIQLFEFGGTVPVFQSNFNIPPRSTPTPTYTPTPTPTLGLIFPLTLFPLTLISP